RSARPSIEVEAQQKGRPCERPVLRSPSVRSGEGCSSTLPSEPPCFKAFALVRERSPATPNGAFSVGRVRSGKPRERAEERDGLGTDSEGARSDLGRLSAGVRRARSK